jgi:hypothetical protein
MVTNTLPPEMGSVDIIGGVNDTSTGISYSLGPTLNFKMEDVHVSHLPMPYGSTNLKVGWLPPMVRWISESGSVVLLERKPEIREIRYIKKGRSHATAMTEADKRSSASVFNILVPWQIFVMGIADNYTPHNIFAFLSPKPLELITDPVYAMPMPNVYGDGRVCAPMLAEMSDTDCFSIAEAVNLSYSMFWSSGFNYDLTNALSVAIEGGMIPNIEDYGNNDDDHIDRFFTAWQNNVRQISDINFVNPGDTENAIAPWGHGEGGVNGHYVNVKRAIKRSSEMMRDKGGSPLGMMVNGLTTAATNHGIQTP